GAGRGGLPRPAARGRLQVRAEVWRGAGRLLGLRLQARGLLALPAKRREGTGQIPGGPAGRGGREPGADRAGRFALVRLVQRAALGTTARSPSAACRPPSPQARPSPGRPLSSAARAPGRLVTATPSERALGRAATGRT